MKRILSILLLLISLQGFAQVGFVGSTTQIAHRGVNATLKLGFPADTFAVTGSLKAYKWVAVKRDTIWLWSQVQNKWLKSAGSGSGSSSDNFSNPLQRIANQVSIKGISTVGLNGQVPISNGTGWAYHYPFNHDSAILYSFETKGRLQVKDGGVNLDTLIIDGTEITAITSKASAYTITLFDHTIECTAGSFTVTLPDASTCIGQVFVIKNTGAGAIVVDGNGPDTIDNAASYTLGSVNKYVGVKSAGPGKFIVISNN